MSRPPGDTTNTERTRHQMVAESFAIKTEAEGGTPRITATLARGNMINRNDRYYSDVVLATAANDAYDRIQNGQFIGLMDHPNWWNGEGDKGRPQNTVIRWTRAWMEGPDLKAEGVIVGTALGKDLQAMYDADVHIGISTNGYALAHWENAKNVPAPYDGDAEELIQVIDELELLTADVVNDPSNIHARIHAEATAARESAQAAKPARKDPIMTIEQQLAEAQERITQLEADNQRLQADLDTANATASRARREAIATEAVARAGISNDAIKTAAVLTACSAESDEAATEAVQAFVTATATTGGNGNNNLPTPEDTKPAKQAGADPLREARTNLINDLSN